MRREYIDERIEFKDDIKKMIYGKASGHCACCGVKLTANNRSIDHAIPLALGGTNDLRNTIPLCRKCNNLKDSDFYWPGSFYIYMHKVNATSMLRETNDYIFEWIDRWCDIEDIIDNPLIASRIPIFLIPLMQAKINKMPKNSTVNDCFVWDICELSREADRVEIWEHTRVRGRDIRSSVRDSEYPYSVYALKKRTQGGWGLLFSMQLMADGILCISELWRHIGHQMSSVVLSFIVKQFHTVWMKDFVGCKRVYITFMDMSSRNDFVNCYMSSEISYKYPLADCSEIAENIPTGLDTRWDNIKDRTLLVHYIKEVEHVNVFTETAIEEVKKQLRKRR